MTQSARFADVLEKALYRIKSNTGKGIGVIEDEIGYTLRDSAAEYIRYLRKGNIPSSLDDLEILVRELVNRRGLEQTDCEELLRCANHPDARRLSNILFSTTSLEEEASDLVVDIPPKSFVCGPPITNPRMFFGRKQLLQRIFNRYKSVPFEHIIIIGERRSGKTSLLHYLSRITTTTDLRPEQKIDWLPNPRQYRWIWVDFQNPVMCQQEKLLQYLLSEMNLPIPRNCNLESFFDVMSDHTWEQHTIILMDEIGKGLIAPDISLDFWGGLRSLVMSDVTQGKLGYVLAAHESLVEMAEDRGKTSPFWNMFVTEPLGPFTDQEARELIGSSPHAFSVQDIDWILKNSGRWPSLIQIFCRERLLALESGDAENEWKQRGLNQIDPYRYLLEELKE